MPKPVCVKCRCFYRPEKNGYRLIEGKPDKRLDGMYPDDFRGNKFPEAWSPYKVWVADLWKCPECFHEIVVGFAEWPLSQDYMENFEGFCKTAAIQVNDC